MVQQFSNDFSNFAVTAAFFVVILAFIYCLYQYHQFNQNRFKTFSTKFSNLISTNRSAEYNEYLAGKRVVKLENHPDFYHFRNTQFFNGLLCGIENIKIPVGPSYGLCAVLTANYDKIRSIIDHPLFLSESRFNLLKVYLICDEVQLNTILLNNKNLISLHERIFEYSPENLDSALSFMKLYFLYLYCLEDPYTARNLNARDFYDFIIPEPFYQSECQCNQGFQYQKEQAQQQNYPKQPAYNPKFKYTYQPSAPAYAPEYKPCPYPVNNNIYPPPAGFKPEFLY